jgi:DNA-binding NarL/FixJ family response regulator
MTLNPHPNPHPSRQRILVAHPEPLFAVGIAAALREQPAFDVLASACDAGLYSGAEGDIVVTDYEGGLSLAQDARRHGPMRCRILVMTLFGRERDVRAAMEAGVHGYLLLSCSIEEMSLAARTLARGERYLSFEVAQKMADSLTHDALTARESDVLQLLARGHCNKSIARDLDITVGTVKGHLRAIFGKLQATSRTQAIGIAARRGLIDAPALAGSSLTGWSRPGRSPMSSAHIQRPAAP